jgi:ABC-2 type transport system ATP-binding protein
MVVGAPGVSAHLIGARSDHKLQARGTGGSPAPMTQIRPLRPLTPRLDRGRIHHMMKNPAAVVVRDLVVQRGAVRAIRGLSFTSSAGQVTGLLGPSGCGKSTLMRAIVGVQVVTSGTVEVLGLPAGDKRLRDRVGYVTQATSVYDDLTIAENLRFFARVLGVEQDEVARCIEAVDLVPARNQVVSRLSGGQRSRVSLAVALLGSPEVLVLDEPTVGLDPVLRRDLWAMFHELADAGTALLVSSHVMDEAERCDRLLLMREGALLADETPSTLLERTGTHDIEAAFLSLVDQASRDTDKEVVA